MPDGQVGLMADQITVGQTNVVFVGRKPLAIYLARVVTLLATSKAVIVIARGRFISKAVVVAVRAIKATGCRYEVVIDEDVLQSGEQARRVPKMEVRLYRPSQGA